MTRHAPKIGKKTRRCYRCTFLFNQGPSLLYRQRGIMSAPTSPSSQKALWPELINKHCDEVKKVIEAERPDLKLEVRSISDSVPEGIVHTRIRIFCDKDGIVRFIPKVG
jgi:hypothetical protein